jgi:hypothetical protein
MIFNILLDVSVLGCVDEYFNLLKIFELIMTYVI